MLLSNKMSQLKKLPINFNNDGCSLVVNNVPVEFTEASLAKLADDCIGCRIFEAKRKHPETGVEHVVRTGFLKFTSNTMALQNLYKMRDTVVNGDTLFVRVKKSPEQIATDKKQAHKRWLERVAERKRKRAQERREQARALFEERQKAITKAQEVGVLHVPVAQREPRTYSKPVHREPVQRVRAEPPVDQQDWTCRECGVYNFANRKQCLKCKAERKWQCKKCSEVVSINNLTCTKCKTDRDPRPWFCGECEFRNRPTSEKCYSCEAPKSKAKKQK